MNSGHHLQGLRVFVAEDEMLVAMLIEEMCADLGCEVIGPAATLEDALEQTRQGNFDVALIDMNLAGQRADPVIAELQRRCVPFAIASGGDVSSDQRAVTVLAKPFGFAQFTDCLIGLAEQKQAGDASGEGS